MYDANQFDLERNEKPIRGQECICPDGLGRVEATFIDGRVQVETYIKNRSCSWDRKNVQLVPILGIQIKFGREQYSQGGPGTDPHFFDSE
jgi:hypothetical protein